FLRRYVEADAAPRRLERLAEPADVTQQDQWLVGLPVLQPGFDGGVVEGRPAAHRRALETRRRGRAVAIELDGPQERGPLLVGKQAGGAFADDGREHRNSAIGQVHGDPARE